MKRWSWALWVWLLPGTAAAGELLAEDFDGPSTMLDPFLAQSASSVTTEAAFSGEHALRMDNSEAGLFSARFPLGVSVEHAYARYMFRMGDADSPCWDAGQHYKNMGFEGGTNDCKGGDYTSDGTDCFTVRTRFNHPHLGVRVESAPYPGLFDTVVDSVDASDGEWHCLEVDVHLNDPGQQNGVIDVRVDGQPAAATGLEFRTVASLQIDKWWFTYWANDEWCGPLFLDDLVVSDAPIGCPGDPPDGETDGGDDETGAATSATSGPPTGSGPGQSSGEAEAGTHGDDDDSPGSSGGDGTTGAGTSPVTAGIDPSLSPGGGGSDIGCGCQVPRHGGPAGVLAALIAGVAMRRRKR